MSAFTGSVHIRLPPHFGHVFSNALTTGDITVSGATKVVLQSVSGNALSVDAYFTVGDPTQRPCCTAVAVTGVVTPVAGTKIMDALLKSYDPDTYDFEYNAQCAQANVYSAGYWEWNEAEESSSTKDSRWVSPYYSSNSTFSAGAHALFGHGMVGTQIVKYNGKVLPGGTYSLSPSSTVTDTSSLTLNIRKRQPGLPRRLGQGQSHPRRSRADADE